MDFSATEYAWGTKNDVDAAIEQTKKAYASMPGLSVTSKKVSKSQSEWFG